MTSVRQMRNTCFSAPTTIDSATSVRRLLMTMSMNNPAQARDEPPTRSLSAQPVEPLVTPVSVEPVQEPVGSPIRKDSGKRVQFQVAQKG